jgi:hypothetical protein
MKSVVTGLAVLVSIGAGCRVRGPVLPGASALDGGVLFDDFDYAGSDGLAGNGWIVRREAGWPGVPGATWWGEGVSLVDDPQRKGNRLLRLTAGTDGTPGGTNQAQVCHERKYREGTYAVRVRFTDEPLSGPDGDQIVQTFYAISPLVAPMDPSYSESDYEYLPNGGWGEQAPMLHFTTWETFRPEPHWEMVNAEGQLPGSRVGWHVLVTQIADEKVKYFVDGVLAANHGQPYYPESLMSINFNLWFIKDGLAASREPRRYVEDVDWVFFEGQVVLSPAEVETRVGQLRTAAVRFKDTVPRSNPPLPSPCNF